MARVTLKPAPVRFPLVLLWLARELALVNEPLLVLLGVVPCSADWFLMDVVLWSFVYLLEPRCRMFVDLEVVLVKCPLPGFCTLIEDCCIGGPGGIPLPPPEVWLALGSSDSCGCTEVRCGGRGPHRNPWQGLQILFVSWG